MMSSHRSKLKLGILGSGRGSNFIAIADAIERGALVAEIVLVGSDFAEAPILTEARKRGLRTYASPPSQLKTKLEAEIERAFAEQLEQAEVELVVFAGFMRIVREPLLNAFSGRMLNLHPSLLPAFKGLRAWEQALAAGVRTTGCTVHWVNEELDGGPIVAQEEVPVLEGDTPASLHQRIQKAEHALLPAVLQKIALGEIALVNPKRVSYSVSD